MSKILNIAIVSPNKNSYSETFIQAQKERLKGNMFYYFNGFMPTKLEGHDDFIIKHGGLKKKLGLIGSDILAQSLENSFKQEKIDIVLAQYGPTGETVASICKKLNIPLVVHFHGYDASVDEVINRYDNYKCLFEVAHSVIVVSNVMYDNLLKLGCPEEKLCYNVYGANPDFQKVVTKFIKKQAVAIGRFTDKKAPYYTILAFKELLKHHPDAKLLFAGKGELLEVCENLVRHEGLQDSIKLIGVINHEELIKLFSESLCFLQHSITANNGDQEGTPLAILEACLAGLPVVSTYHAGIQDVISHNETGLLVKEHDVADMAKQMIRLFDDIDFAKSVGEKAKAHHISNFSMKRYIDKLDTILLNAFESV